MYDILIKNGMIYDGTGNRPYSADILIKGKKIEKIGGPFEASCAKTVIEAEGLCVSPGFIDPHTHNDFTFVHEKENINGLMQGVTTQIVGLCGLGPVPMRLQDRETGMQLYSGIFGKWSYLPVQWENLTEYLEKANGARINVAAAVSHCALRVYCAGYEDVTYNDVLKTKMQKVLEELLDQGAVAFSTGLDYYPARICRTQELIDLCKIVKEKNRVFMIHTRPFTAEYTPMGEVFKIAKDTGVKTHVLHTKTYYPDTCGHPEAITDNFEKAMADGCDLTSEFYPYSAFASYAVSFLPSWAMEGDFDTIISILSNPEIREKLVEDTFKGYTDFMIGATPARFTDVGGHPEYVGLTFDEVAEKRNQSIGEMIVDVLYESKLQVCMRASEPEDAEVRKTLQDDFMKLLTHPMYTIGSDTIDAGEKPHPRACGTFAKIIHLSSEYNYPLEKLIHKITLFNANRFSLLDRGVIEEGKIADISIFDYKNMKDLATYDEPRRIADGVKYVLVNGQMAVENGSPTQNYAGEALKYQAQ